MELTVIGCGDAFGAGGRLQTSFHVRSDPSTFLIDCGATSLIGLRRQALEPNDIGTVFVTHLHGDHFGGLPWLMLDARYVSNRTRPLVVVGPKGIEERYLALTEALYANSSAAECDFDLVFVEYEECEPLELSGVRVTPFEVHHPCGASPYALRFEVEGKIVSFTGDTGWVDVLPEVASDADLFISECFQYDVPHPIHLNYLQIDQHYERLKAKRILLTHMGREMLAQCSKVDSGRYMIGEEGMTIVL